MSRNLPTAVSTEADSSYAGWAELYDIYLPDAISTPIGTTDTLRLCTLPGGCSFYTPQADPEPAGTQGDAATYTFAPSKRETIKASGKFTNDKLVVAFSNVNLEWSQMLKDVEWRDCLMVIRKIPLTASGVPINPGTLTAADCVTLFVGAVDSAQINEEQIALTFSSDLAQFNLLLPRENMHGFCRFSWGDFQCTQIRVHTNHLKAKTADSGCSTTLVKSSGLTEDDGSPPWRGVAVTANSGTGRISLTGHKLAKDQRFKLSGTMPSPLVADTWYYVVGYSANEFQVGTAPGGSATPLTTSGSGLTLTTEAPYNWEDLINNLLDASISASSEVSGSQGYRVKDNYPTDLWKINGDTDWGNNNEGIFQIPDAQAGLTNPLLTPYIQFDLGSAKNPNLWRFSGVNADSRDRMVRLLEVFSSSVADFATYNFEGYFEMPPRQGDFANWVRPGLASAQTAYRYWRVCIRSRWNETFYPHMLRKVRAYVTAGRNYWKDGYIVFDATTATVALQGVSRRILASYNGELECEPLPATPASGDTFKVWRGCGRQFNDCARRLNTENYGGFDPLTIAQLAR